MGSHAMSSTGIAVICMLTYKFMYICSPCQMQFNLCALHAVMQQGTARTSVVTVGEALGQCTSRGSDAGEYMQHASTCICVHSCLTIDMFKPLRVHSIQ